jgi:hypothetical protein
MGCGSEHGKVLCGALKSFFKMQNLVKASTSLNSAHQEQLIAPCLGANGPRGTSNHLPNEIEQYYSFSSLAAGGATLFASG